MVDILICLLAEGGRNTGKIIQHTNFATGSRAMPVSKPTSWWLWSNFLTQVPNSTRWLIPQRFFVDIDGSPQQQRPMPPPHRLQRPFFSRRGYPPPDGKLAGHLCQSNVAIGCNWTISIHFPFLRMIFIGFSSFKSLLIRVFSATLDDTSEAMLWGKSHQARQVRFTLGCQCWP